MNSLMRRFLLCPVPDEQKPMNQYIELKETTFFSWIVQASEKKANLFRSLVFPFLFFFSIQLFFFPAGLLQKVIFSLQILVLVRFFLFFVTFFRWRDSYISFSKSIILYEEASWFDTQFWEKPFFLIKNDKLIATQKIRPQLQRLKKLIVNSLLQFVAISFLVEILLSF